MGRLQLDARALAIAAQLDAKGGAMHGAVAQLLAGEATLGAGALPLARTAVLDITLDPAVRAALLSAIAQAPGQPSLDVAAELFGRLNPTAGVSASATAGADPVETAWRRFVGDRRRMGELDYFITMAKTAPPANRVLAYAVLVQSIRGPRTPPQVREKVTPVLEAAWSDPTSAPSLVQAIGIMRLDAQYAERLATYLQSRKQ